MIRFLCLSSFFWVLAGTSGCAYDLTSQGKECDSEHSCPPGLVCTEQGEILVCLPEDTRDAGEPSDGDGNGDGSSADSSDGDSQPCLVGQDCDDGNECTHSDSCTQGVCAGVEYSCDDQNECTDDSCNGDGECAYLNNSQPCDDSNTCTHTDLCSEAICAGTGYSCDDSNPCTDDACNGDDTCSHVDSAASCNDSDPCTREDVCLAGVCAGLEYSCDDANPCTSDSCNGDGTCDFVSADAECSDNDLCTHSDLCVAGNCQGEPYSCDDSNMCTDDTCDGTGGCLQVNSLGPCDDGSFCNGQDACDGAGDCSMHIGNPCGVHVCEEDTDTCEGVGEEVFSQLVIGYWHSCGLTPSGLIYCWGNDEYGQLGNGGGANDSQVAVAVDTTFVTGQTPFVQLTAGFYHTCGLTSQGVAYCWGWDLYGQLGDGGGSSDSQSPVAVDLDPIGGETAMVLLTGGGWHTCGLTAEGTAYCWGRDQYGQLGDGLAGTDSQSPVAVEVSTITGQKRFAWLNAGYYHTCGVTSQGTAYCWGRDFEGQLGDGGSNEDSPNPVAVDTAGLNGQKAITRLDGGGWHTCGQSADGKAICWGNPFNGQLGDGGTGNDSQIPVELELAPIVGESVFVHLSGGGWHSCGLTTQGSAYCWGRDEYGQLGDGGVSSDTQAAVGVYSFPFQGGDPLRAIIAGAYHSCGLTPAGAAYCWGRDDYGQLGDGGTSNDTQIPVAVNTASIDPGHVFVQIATGGKHSCGLTAGGVAYCWGIDDAGQLGDGGDPSESQSPVPVSTSSIVGEARFVWLTAGEKHTCGLTAAGLAYCWGSDMKGQLGDGDVSNESPIPVAVDTTSMTGLKTFVALAAGEDFSCGLTASGVAYCWGGDDKGQLGNGVNLGESQGPVAVDTGQITGEPGLVQLATGNQHACGLTAEGVAYCWGYDHAGQLGNDAALEDSQSPVAVDVQGTFARLTAGNGHSCGLTTSGSVYCWGSDNSGQLGDGGTSTGSPIPVAIDPGSVAGQTVLVQVAAGDQHTCALTAQGVAHCWGRDDKGQLCDGGSSVNSQSPVAIDSGPIGEALVDLSAGGKHGCIRTARGVVFCCGDDGHGQLGDGGTSLDSQSPVLVDTTTIR